MKTPIITFAWRFPDIAAPRLENCRSASHTSNVTAEAAVMALSVTSRSLVTSPVLVGAGRFGGALFDASCVRSVWARPPRLRGSGAFLPPGVRGGCVGRGGIEYAGGREDGSIASL